MSVSKSLYLAGFRCSALALSVAFSAQASAAGATPEVVNVIGQGAQLEQALQDQRMSDSVESVVHADAIGQLKRFSAFQASRSSATRAKDVLSEYAGWAPI